MFVDTVALGMLALYSLGLKSLKGGLDSESSSMGWDGMRCRMG